MGVGSREGKGLCVCLGCGACKSFFTFFHDPSQQIQKEWFVLHTKEPIVKRSEWYCAFKY
jgi:hypothetical protein